MQKTGDSTFSINANIEEVNGQIPVEYKETTDGKPYYALSINGQEVQLRKEDDKWEQLWGELSEESVEKLGNAISERIDEQP